MLRNLRSRRGRGYGVLVCVVVWCVVVLACGCVCVSLIHRHVISERDFKYDTLLSDSGNEDYLSDDDTVDTIDALDVVDEDLQDTLDADGDDDEPIDQTAGYFFHHAQGVIRRGFRKTSFLDDRDNKGPFLDLMEDPSKTAFASDDVAVEETVRSKAIQVKDVEDALLFNFSPLRQGWGEWFDKKADFLRKDKMLRSNIDPLNPLRNPILQDPDVLPLTPITKPDQIIRNYLLHHLKTLPFPSRKITQYHNYNL